MHTEVCFINLQGASQSNQEKVIEPYGGSGDQGQEATEHISGPVVSVMKMDKDKRSAVPIANITALYT